MLAVAMYFKSQQRRCSYGRDRVAARRYGRGVESFDVYSPPISTLYSQVFWAALDPVDLPKRIVERYANATMALVGFELDQVTEVDGEERSISIKAAYNHHFEATLVGAGASLRKVTFSGADDPRRAALASKMGHAPPLEAAYARPSGTDVWSLAEMGARAAPPSRAGRGPAAGCHVDFPTAGRRRCRAISGGWR